VKIPVAIDGPVASGKSVIGERLAGCLSALFVDTGAMYRACTWRALEEGISPRDEAALGALAAAIDFALEPPTVADGRQYTVLVDGADVTWAIRSPEVERAVSEVSKVAAVREAMVARQRRLAAGRPVVMVGRDIGTVVLPDAPLKVYLTASPEVRAARRLAELRARGQDAPLFELLADIRRRDAIDSGRENSPLRAAPDAIVVQTDDLSVDQVVAHLAALAKAA
jgi:cytidylate kinase